MQKNGGKKGLTILMPASLLAGICAGMMSEKLEHANFELEES